MNPIKAKIWWKEKTTVRNLLPTPSNIPKLNLKRQTQPQCTRAICWQSYLVATSAINLMNFQWGMELQGTSFSKWGHSGYPLKKKKARLQISSFQKFLEWWWKSLSHVQLSVTPWAVACQVPLSMEFSRQEYWSGLPFPSPGYLPNPGIKPRSPSLQADPLQSEPSGKFLEES